MLAQGTGLITSLGNVIFASDSSEFRYSTEDGNRNLLFIRNTDEYGTTSTRVRTNGSRTSDSMTKYETYEMANDGISFVVYDTVLDKIAGSYTAMP